MAKKISASDIFSEEDIFLGIRNSAEKTILTFQEIDAEVKKLGANIKKDLSGADFGNTKGINNFVAATQKANDAKNKSIQIDKVLVQATKDVAAADKALIDIEIKKQKLVQEEIRTAQQKAKIEQSNANAIAKTVKAAKDQESAYKRLVVSTRDLKTQSTELAAQMREMSIAGQKGTAAYTTLETQFKEVTIAAQTADTELKAIDKTVGDNFRNVGNYEGATKGLKQQLREMTVALQNMESTDPRFKQMTIDAGELKDKIMDTNAVIKSTAGSAVENLGTGIAKAGKVGIDAFAGMTGAMGLFGIESEGAMQAMLKLQQLAAMSEALTSLGALGDTVTEVKAAFIAAATKLGIFTTAKEVDVAVTETQVVATNAATVSTNFLGKAMKALPIIAIIAGIAALAYGIYSLVSGNEEAAKATKKREEAEKRAAEETKKHAEFVATESVELVGLIYQLKNTNQNSKERSSLITKINAQYGTTLRNLSNETAFQAALNLAVEDYLNFQRQKYQLAKYGKLTELALAKEDKLNSEILKRKKDINKEQEMGLALAKQQGMNVEETRQTFYGADVELQKMNAEMDALHKRMLAYGGVQVKLRSETEGRYVPVVKDATGSTKDLSDATKDLKDATDAENESLQKKIDLLAQHNALIDEIQAYNASKVIEYNVENQIKNIQETGKYSMDVIQMLIDAEYELQKAILERQYKEAYASAETQQQILDAEKKYQFELGKLKTQTAQKTTEINQKLENEQETFDKNRVDAEKVVTDKEKEELQKRLKTQEEFIKATTDFFIKNSEKKIAQMDKEISKAESQYTVLQQLAANGNINAQESLAEQQRIINEANARKDKEMKRQQRIKLAESVYSTYNSKVASGSEHPLMDTIKDTMLLQQFIASLPTFFDGTEDTGKNGNGIDGKGGFHAVLHPNERVIPKSLNEQIGGLSNEALAKMASEYQNGKIIRSNSQIGSAFDTAILVGKLDELTTAIKQKPETNIGIGEITQSVMEIVKSTKQGNTTTYNRYKVRR